MMRGALAGGNRTLAPERLGSRATGKKIPAERGGNRKFLACTTNSLAWICD